VVEGDEAVGVELYVRLEVARAEVDGAVVERLVLA